MVGAVSPRVMCLEPGGARAGPLFASLLAKLDRDREVLAAGLRVGPYRIVEQLGRGGMAVVYLAERDGKRVALKVNASNEARELLRRERQILSELHHPHIARLLDGGTTDDGLVWFAMELVRGARIDVACRRLPHAVRLRLFLDVCDAVQFVHQRGLVHRDLKPSNILVTEEGRVKLIDFGIAVFADERPLPAFTPGWASPEQRQGDPISSASDIWQLGRLLALIEGERAIVERATNEDPALRYSSAGELAADVSRLAPSG